MILNQAYKHIFTSPSSVGREPKATRSGNARIHNMVRVTLASIAYVATQVSNLAMPSMDNIRRYLGSICTMLFRYIFQDGHRHRF
jgi:hypothetical protein